MSNIDQILSNITFQGGIFLRLMLRENWSINSQVIDEDYQRLLGKHQSNHNSFSSLSFSSSRRMQFVSQQCRGKMYF